MSAPVARDSFSPNMGAVSSVALRVPIPVCGNGTRSECWILLPRGTVLGQRNPRIT